MAQAIVELAQTWMYCGVGIAAFVYGYNKYQTYRYNKTLNQMKPRKAY